MSKLTPEGKATLERVALWLETGAKHVDIDGRSIDKFDMATTVEETSCGTACCIAGAVHQFAGLGIEFNGFGHISFYGAFGLSQIAAEHIGIGAYDARVLFEPWTEYDDYPEMEQYNDPFVAAKVIRNFLETGQIDWLKFLDEK